MTTYHRLGRFALISALCSIFVAEWWINRVPTFPTCSKSDFVDYMKSVSSFVGGSAKRGELKAECVFSEFYSEARQKFLKRAMQMRGSNFEAYLSGFEIGKGVHGGGKGETVHLVTDYLIMRGSKTKFLFYFAGVHGTEGFAGSAVEIAVLDYLQLHKETLDRYSETAVLRDQAKLAEEDPNIKPVEIDESSLPPTIVVVHAINPFGMHHNRRVNEDNIDINRNYLTQEVLDNVGRRDPNFAGYLDLDFMLNPRGFPSSLTIVNDVYSHLKSAFALLRYGLEPIKKTLLAGNYFRASGLAYGGKKQSASVKNMISLLDVVDVSAAEKITLIDLHTGLGPSGTDTLAMLKSGEKKDVTEEEFADYIESKFPAESDLADPKWKGGMKALSSAGKRAGSAMSGYDLTIGIVDDYCSTFLAPHLADKKDLLCITQEFGTVDTVKVGKALIEENTAWHHGTESEKALYGRRLRDAFYVQDAKWMNSIVHRGLTVFKQAFATVA